MSAAKRIHRMRMWSNVVILVAGALLASVVFAADAPVHAPEPWSGKHDASPAFSPDGNAVVFTRGRGLSRRLYIAHRRHGAWSSPRPVSFSNRWMDIEPAMAPDGSYLVFVSNRPAHAGGKALDGYWGGKMRPGRGGNLWRVDRVGDHWGVPRRLPDIVNVSPAIYSPSVASDGSLFFVRIDRKSGLFRLYRSRRVDGRYRAARPLALGAAASSDYDPAIAPDQSYLVFSSDRKPVSADGDHLFMAFASGDGWSRPVDLGMAGDEARLGADRGMLFFNGADGRIHTTALPLRLAPLAWFSGAWDCAGQFASGRPIASSETFELTMGGHWLRMRHADMPPNRYAAVEWWGYDAQAGRYTITIFDSGGGMRRFISAGWLGDMLTLCNMATGAHAECFALQRLEASRYRVTYAVEKAAGAWKAVDTLVCRRKRPAKPVVQG